MCFVVSEDVYFFIVLFMCVLFTVLFMCVLFTVLFMCVLFNVLFMCVLFNVLFMCVLSNTNSLEEQVIVSDFEPGPILDIDGEPHEFIDVTSPDHISGKCVYVDQIMSVVSVCT